MLHLSSMSSISRDSSSWIGNVDLEIVDRIIETAPRSATTLKQVHTAYSKVLQDHDLDPKGDSIYYQFLLKLGVVRATTWGERWDIWRETHAHEAGGPPRSPTVEETDRFRTIRTRVPFLAGASSDLDDAYDRTYEGDEESVSSAGERAAEAGHEVSDAEVSTSLVGHTPSPSVASVMDLFDLDPPARTSTPVQGRHRGHLIDDRSSTPLAQSDMEDLSNISGEYTVSLDEDDSHLVEGASASTPRGENRSLDSSFAVQDDDVSELDPMLAWKLERQADEFLRTGLLGRCWEAWTAQTCWVLGTTEQIETVRNKVLLRQTLAKWRSVHEQHLDMPNTADAHYRHAVQARILNRWLQRFKDASLARREAEWATARVQADMRSTWKQWRFKLVQQRTDRWQRDMLHREKQFVKQKEQLSLSDAFQIWREQTQCAIDCRTADRVHAGNLLQRVLDEWRQASERHHVHVRLLEDLAQRRRQRDLETLFLWSRAVQLRQTERQFRDTADQRLLSAVYADWRTVHEDQQTARAMYERRLKSRALSNWLKHRQKHKADERKAEEMCSTRDKLAMRTCLHAWIASGRGRLLLRVREDRVVRRAFGQIQANVKRKAAQEKQAIALADKRDHRHQHQAFSRWREVTSDKATAELRALLVYDENRLKVALRKWVSASAKVQNDTTKADKAQVFFALRTAWSAWQGALTIKKQENWVREREHEDVREVFEHWKLAVIRSMQDRQAFLAFQRKQDKRLLARALSRWTESVVKVKVRELDVLENRNEDILRDSMMRWVKASVRIREAKALMTSFVDMRTEEHLRSCLLHWRAAARASRERKAAQTEVESRHEKRIIAEALAVWRDKARERGLAPIEEETSNRHEDAVLFAVWDKWKARATLLPAVRFDNTCRKRDGWHRWRRALDRARTAKKVSEAKDRQIIEDVFVVWSDAAKTRGLQRAKRIRERTRPSLPPPTERTVRGPAAPAAAPRRSVPSHTAPQAHARSRSVSQRVGPEAQPDVASPQRYAETTISEPAYSRLRSELARRRAGSDEPERVDQISADEGVIRALKGRLAR